MTRAYSTLRVAPSADGVLGVVMDAPPMNLIGPEEAGVGSPPGVGGVQHLQTRGPLELDLGDRLGAL